MQKIKSSGYVQWDVYRILREAFCPYREIELKTAAITKDMLIKNMQFDNYVKMNGQSTKGDKRKYVIAILSRNEKGGNEIASMTEKFRLFINSIKEGDAEIIIVSPCKFQTHVLNHIYESGLAKRINRYYYDHFKVVVPLGPYCSPHTVLNPEEARKTIEQHNLELKEMKKIYTFDAQVIWSGAQPGQIVRIDRYNSSSGRSTDYRRVVAAMDL